MFGVETLRTTFGSCLILLFSFFYLTRKTNTVEKKTYKRELALVFSGILVWEIYNGNTEMVEIIVWPIISLIAAAAGLHIYGGMQQGSTKPSDRGRH